MYITLAELFQYTLVIVGIIGLIISANKEVRPPSPQTVGLTLTK